MQTYPSLFPTLFFPSPGLQVVDSGVPYAIVRANGTDSLLDSETEVQFITLAPLGTLLPTAFSSGEQVGTHGSHRVKQERQGLSGLECGTVKCFRVRKSLSGS